jgi:CheY-like chemotaxis protein
MTHKILTVDDHPETLNAVVDALQGFGYEVFSSLSPFKGLEIAQAEQPDLILLDVNMPGMNGNEFARQLRARSSWPISPSSCSRPKAA